MWGYRPGLNLCGFDTAHVRLNSRAHGVAVTRPALPAGPGASSAVGGRGEMALPPSWTGLIINVFSLVSEFPWLLPAACFPPPAFWCEDDLS